MLSEGKSWDLINMIFLKIKLFIELADGIMYPKSGRFISIAIHPIQSFLT